MAAIFRELDHQPLSLTPTPITPVSQKKINTLTRDFRSPLPTPTVLSFSTEDDEACSSTFVATQRPALGLTGIRLDPSQCPRPLGRGWSTELWRGGGGLRGACSSPPGHKGW